MKVYCNILRGLDCQLILSYSLQQSGKLLLFYMLRHFNGARLLYCGVGYSFLGYAFFFFFMQSCYPSRPNVKGLQLVSGCLGSSLLHANILLYGFKSKLLISFFRLWRCLSCLCQSFASGSEGGGRPHPKVLCSLSGRAGWLHSGCVGRQGWKVIVLPSLQNCVALSLCVFLICEYWY